MSIESTDPQRVGIDLIQSDDAPALKEKDWDVIKEKTEPMRAKLRALTLWCEEQGIVVDRALNTSGTLIVFADSEQVAKLVTETRMRGWFKDVQPCLFQSQVSERSMNAKID